MGHRSAKYRALRKYCERVKKTYAHASSSIKRIKKEEVDNGVNSTTAFIRSMTLGRHSVMSSTLIAATGNVCS